MLVRNPIVAGRFYPDSPARCREELAACMRAAGELNVPPAPVYGGIVPHAGWMCSGRVAAGVFQALALAEQPATLVMLGAVHQWPGRQAALFGSGRWETPLGAVEIDEDLARRVLAEVPGIVDEPRAHEFEHSLEVQMPFVKHLFPGAKVLPIMVPPMDDAPAIGTALGGVLAGCEYPTAIVGTTDLTHYGPSYRFEPEGRGPAALRWAKEVNDRRLLALIEAMDAGAIVPEALAHHNGCGPGAVASTIAAAAAKGANAATVLEHTTSFEVLGSRGGHDAVGYVGVVFSRR